MEVETIAIVMGVVEAAKRAGLAGRACFIFAIVLAFVLFGLEQAALMYPVMSAVYTILRYALYGVAATGWYDLVQAAVGK